MSITKVVMMFVVLVVFSVININRALSQDDQESEEMAIDEELEQELKWLQAETYVITPSRIPEKIKKASSSVTVVTDKQIRQMGAKDLADVLMRVVPSFHAERNQSAINGFSLRRFGGEAILIMINSLPLCGTGNQGGASPGEDTLSLDNVKRIEVIRGPGSALHGANAYDAMINIITKKAEDVDGVEFSALGGSWDTQQYNLLFGKTFSDLEVVFNLNVFKTHGNSVLIKEDWQTFDDRNFYPLFGRPPISLAPGYTKEHDEKLDLAVNLAYKGFTFDGRYIDRETELPLDAAFPNYRLTDKSTRSFEKYTLNLGYETAIREGFDFSAKAYRVSMNNGWNGQMALPGFTALFPPHYGILYMYYPPPNGTVFDQGIFLVTEGWNSRTGIEIQTTYKMNDSNTIVAGATYEAQEFHDDKRGANYLPDPPGIIHLPSMQIWPEEYFFDDSKMNFKAIFLEDVWDITEGLRLTLGGRYDDYSVFGGHFTPRAGLTWEYMKGYDLKLLYGHGFVVPAAYHILERWPYQESFPGPQTMDTYELSLGADFTSSLEGRITFFRSVEKDIIALGGGGWTNLETPTRSHGVEAEARYDFGRGTYIAANFVYFSAKPSLIKRGYTGKIMSNIRLSKYLNLFVDGYHAGGYDIPSWHLGESPSGRTIVNATLIARKFLKGYEGLELRGSVYNLFDKDWSKGVWPTVPYGYPQPGINFLVEVKYRF